MLYDAHLFILTIDKKNKNIIISKKLKIKALSIPIEYIKTALLCFMFLNIYLEVPFDLGNGKVLPAYPYILSIPFVFIVNKKNILNDDLRFVIKIFIILVLSVIFSVGYEYWQNKISGILQTIVSLVASLLFFRLIISVNCRKIEKILFIWLIIIMVGVVLEFIGPLKLLSDSFRQWAYSSGGYGLYENDFRDLAMLGHIRPKFLASEPSVLAIGFMVSLNCWLLLRPIFNRYISVIIAEIISIFIIGSPIMLLSIFLTIILFMTIQNKKKQYIASSVTIAGSIIGSILVLFYNNMIINRLNPDNFGVDVAGNSSENIRLILPLVAALNVNKQFPLFGVGISGKQSAIDIMNIPLIEPNYLVSSNIAALLIYFGVFGSVILVYCIIRYLKKSGIRRIMLLFLFWICLAISMGGFESPRFWGYMFFIAGIFYHADKNMFSIKNNS